MSGMGRKRGVTLMSGENMFPPGEIRKMAAKKEFLVVLTGAGISAESGVPTFRDQGGLWRQFRFQDLATPEAFARDPKLVWEFYQWRYQKVAAALPNDGHRVLAAMEEALGEGMLLVTQNVDDLHQRAGSRRLLPMHGQIARARCPKCGRILEDPYDWRRMEMICPGCCKVGVVRPDVVWFGETPLFMDEILEALERATHFLAVGTSGAVYPAAQFVDLARSAGAKTLLINLDPPENIHTFQRVQTGKAGGLLTALWGGGEGFWERFG